MAVSTLDLVLNVRTKGRGQIKDITRSVTELINTARSSVLLETYEPFKTKTSQLAYSIAFREKELSLTWQQRMAIQELKVLNEEINNKLKVQAELDILTHSIMKEKNVTYMKALKLASQELTIRNLIVSSMQEAEVMGAKGAGALGNVNIPALMSLDAIYKRLYEESLPELENGNFRLEESFNVLGSSLNRINYEGSYSSDVFEDLIKVNERVITQNEKMLNLSAEQRIMLGGQAKRAEETSDAVLKIGKNTELWNKVNKRAYELYSQGNIERERALTLAELEIRSNEELRMKKELLNNEMERARLELMQTSIGLFVLGITTSQTLGALKQMVGGTTELGQAITEMMGGIKLMLGPMQMLQAIAQLQIAVNKKLIMSSLPFVALLGSIYFFYKALTAESKALRVAFGAIAGMLAVLSLLTLREARANLISGISHLFKWVAKLGPAGIPYLPIALGALGAAIGGGLALMARMPKAQTIPGYARPIRETGLVYAHRGEVIGRVGGMQPSATNVNNSRNIVININVESGAALDRGILPRLSREIEFAVASGNGV